MMKQEKLTELNEVINTSGIIESMELLQQKFKIYPQIPKVKDHSYCIRLEFDALTEELNNLENHLADLIDQSNEWEELE
ncbi:MAG: hypothetical protein ACI8ZM_000963 [Crocinitomix sp.]|jgi:hypothetical protein